MPRNATLRAELSARYPDVTFTESPTVLDGDELIALLRGHDRAIVGLERIDDGVLAQVPELKVISKYGVGLDGIDIEAIARRGVKLAWTGGVNRRSVAELTLGFAIALLHRVPEADVALRARRVGRSWIGRQLTGRTVRASSAAASSARISSSCWRRSSAASSRTTFATTPEFYRAHRVTPVSLRRSCSRESDIVSLHVPLDRTTQGHDRRRGAGADARRARFIINAARGGLIDEEALAEALESGHLAGAACDVFTIEPDANPRLLALPTFLGTPHIGGSTQEAQLAMGRAAIDGLENARVPGDGWPC